MHIHIHTCTFTHVHIHTRAHSHTCAFKYIYMCIHAHTHNHTSPPTYAHAHAHARLRTHPRTLRRQVAAGAIAEKWLRERFGIDIVAWVSSVGSVEVPDGAVDTHTVTRADVDANLVRCPHAESVEAMTTEIKNARDDHDSVGGVVSVVCRGMWRGVM